MKHTIYAAPGDWPHARCAHPSAPRMELPAGVHPLSPAYDEEVARRRRLCHHCPHLDPCRTWALTAPDPAGPAIAGGLTPAERARARRASR